MSTFSFNIFSEAVQQQVRRQTYAANEMVFSEDSPAEAIFLVETGCVRLVVFPQDGKQLVLYRARSGETFAEEHLALEKYAYRAVTDEPTILHFVSKGVLLNDINTNPVIARRFIECISGRYYQLRMNFERLGISSAKDRVLHLLKTFGIQRGPEIDLAGKVKSLSDDLNLTHEAMYRALRELERDGLIRRDGGVIKICEIPSGK
jgi:CRP-like cAMP-binding protein